MQTRVLAGLIRSDVAHRHLFGILLLLLPDVPALLPRKPRESGVQVALTKYGGTQETAAAMSTQAGYEYSRVAAGLWCCR
jgi:hypothetical protein